MQPKTPPLNFVAIRQRYQKGLLTWIREPGAELGLRQMRAVLGAVALIQPPDCIEFWRDAETLVQQLIDHPFADDTAFRKVASKLDLQFKRLVRGQFSTDHELWAEMKQVRAALCEDMGDDDYDEDLDTDKVEVNEPLSPQIELPPKSVADATSAPFDSNHPLAAMLAKTASILPFVGQIQLPRFSEEVTDVWNKASALLQQTWGNRYQDGWGGFRSAVFGGLCGAALKIGEPAFLRFSEAMASAMDRVDDDIDPPVHLVAAMAAALDCLAERDFLEHASLYIRLDNFSTRLEKVVDEEIRVSRAIRGLSTAEPERMVEIKLPQSVPEIQTTAEQNSIFDYFNQLRAEVPNLDLAEGDAPQSVEDAIWQPLKIDKGGLQVDEIPLVQWGDTPMLAAESSDIAEEEVADADSDSDLDVSPDLQLMDSTPVATLPEVERKPLDDGQLLGRVARDLEALADSLHLSGLSRQAGDLASLVDRIAFVEVNHNEVRADLLQVIQFMQDQVGAVVMGFPPHANPKITSLMEKLETTISASP